LKTGYPVIVVVKEEGVMNKQAFRTGSSADRTKMLLLVFMMWNEIMKCARGLQSIFVDFCAN
jgi:hypothetical protein